MSKKKAEIFIDEFKPYRSKYTIQEHNNLFHDLTWVTKNKYLTKNLIEKSILEFLTVGYFITHSTVFLSIDIDDHKNLGEAYLLNIYNQVIQRLSITPSIDFKSPRGFHVYYFFTESVPTEIITKQAKERLKGLPVEIKPTQNTSLRIPAESQAIDPHTMQLLNMPFEDCLKSCQKYHPAELFDMDILPSVIKQSLREKKQSLKKLKAIPKIDKIEKNLMPFINHNTNDTFLKLCNVYRCSGLDEDEAFYRFTICLLNSPNYFGDLRNERRLKQRIKCEYKNNEFFVPIKKSKTENIFTDVITKNILKLSPFGYQRNNAIKKFITKLLSWVDYQDEIFANKKELAIWDYLYPYYRKLRKARSYPLPALMMRKWNFRYHELIKFFININFLIPIDFTLALTKSKTNPETTLLLNNVVAPVATAPESPPTTLLLNNVVAPVAATKKSSYAADLGMCKYYRIDIEKFLF